jgi:hypothetical protein
LPDAAKREKNNEGQKKKVQKISWQKQKCGGQI